MRQLSTPTTATAIANICVGCHKVAGEGGESVPDLSRVGARRDAAGIKRITTMPPYWERLTEQQIDALVQYLSKRR